MTSKMVVGGVGLFLAGLLTGVGTVTMAQPPDPATCANVEEKAYVDCRWSELDDRLRALEPSPTATPTPSETSSSPTPTPTPSETETPTPTPTPSETETTTPTPTPTPTEPSPTPTPTVTPGGFPNASNTGVQDGIVLRPSASINATVDGQTYENLLVSGTVNIRANNVTLRNVKVVTTGTYPISITSGANVRVEYVEVDAGPNSSIGIYIRSAATNPTVSYADIHGGSDGIRIGADGTTIQHSYVHDLDRVPDGHHDSLQIRSGDDVTVRHNTLQAYKASTNDPMNASIQIGSLSSGHDPISNFRVLDNYMDGGNHTYNGGGASDTDSVVVAGNRFGPHFRYSPAGNIYNTQWANTNVYDLTGLPVR